MWRGTVILNQPIAVKIKSMKNHLLSWIGYMQQKGKGKFSAWCLLLALMFSGPAFSHGLTMTTAELTLRNNNHLTMAIRTSIPPLFKQMEWPEKPASLVHLMAEDGKDLALFRAQLATLFLQEMPVTFAGYKLISPNLRLPKLSKLRQQIEREISLALLPPMEGDEHDRSNYLVAYLDGFIPKKALSSTKQSHVEVVFPEALADIMVSFNRPLVQTLPATNKKRVYQESF